MSLVNRLFLIGLLATAIACTPANEKLAGQIKILENEVLSDSANTVDLEKARELLVLYERYAAENPNDTLSMYYLFKAGDIANGTGEYMKAIGYYKQCADAQTFARREIAFFLRGFIYENQLGDLENARRVYVEFLDKFKDHPLAKDVQFSLDNLGKSPEDLIRMFEQRDSLGQPADTALAS